MSCGWGPNPVLAGGTGWQTQSQVEGSTHCQHPWRCTEVAHSAVVKCETIRVRPFPELPSSSPISKFSWINNNSVKPWLISYVFLKEVANRRLQKERMTEQTWKQATKYCFVSLWFCWTQPVGTSYSLKDFMHPDKALWFWVDWGTSL